MLLEFDFAVTQTAYVKGAMTQIAAFRPDGLTPTQVQTLIDSATPIRAAYVSKRELIDTARTSRHTTVDAVHDACVDFLAQARSRFRKDRGISERLERLPTKDQTFQQTLVRADATLALWATLPQVGSPLAAFAVGQGSTTLSVAGFTALITAARAADAAIPGVDQDFQSAEATMHAKLAELEDFVTAALAVGRSQFDEGTPEREIIDAIPTDNGGSGAGEPPAPEPGPELPTAPQNVEVATGAPESGEVTVSWGDNPAEENVTLYHVRSGSTELGTSATSPITLSGFTSGETVSVMVTAENAAGEGPGSPRSGTAG